MTDTVVAQMNALSVASERFAGQRQLRELEDGDVEGIFGYPERSAEESRIVWELLMKEGIAEILKKMHESKDEKSFRVDLGVSTVCSSIEACIDELERHGWTVDRVVGKYAPCHVAAHFRRVEAKV